MAEESKLTELGGVEFVRAHDVAEMTLNVWGFVETYRIWGEIADLIPFGEPLNAGRLDNLRNLPMYNSNWISLGQMDLKMFGHEGKGLVLARKTDASWLPFQKNEQTGQFTERNTANGEELMEIGALLIFPPTTNQVYIRIVKTEYNQ